eukprot:jgi/Astpho2/1110/e_gw1.00020.52.1_t
MSSLRINSISANAPCLQAELEQEISSLAQSSMALQGAAGELGDSGQAIQHLAQQKEGQPMMIPLASALYVAAELAVPDKVLVDIGTGYFSEKATDEGVDYCRRRVNNLKENIEAIGKIMHERRSVMMRVNQVLQSKMAAQNAAQTAAL